MNANPYIELADGTRIDAATGQVIDDRDDEEATDEFVEVPNNEEAKQHATTVRRRLLDMPVPPSKMNVVSVVVSYTMYGLEDYEIGTALGLSVEQIERIKQTDAFDHMYKAVVDAIVAQDLDDVRQSFIHYSRKAADRIHSLVNSGNAAIALKASQDVLDRAGHRPADIVEHRHHMEDPLQIEIIEKTGDDNIPTDVIDVTPERVQ